MKLKKLTENSRSNGIRTKILIIKNMQRKNLRVKFSIYLQLKHLIKSNEQKFLEHKFSKIEKKIP